MGNIGHMYMLGLGVRQSNDTARHYFAQGQERGCVGGLVMLCICVSIYIHIISDRRVTHALYPDPSAPQTPQPTRKPHDSDAASLNGLGHLYMHGMGVDQDLDRALKYLSKASHDKNHAESHYNLGLIYAGLVVGDDNSKLGAEKAAAAATGAGGGGGAGGKKGKGQGQGKGGLRTEFDDMKESARKLVDDPALAHLPKELLEMVAGMAEEVVDWERQVGGSGVGLGGWGRGTGTR